MNPLSLYPHRRWERVLTTAGLGLLLLSYVGASSASAGPFAGRWRVGEAEILVRGRGQKLYSVAIQAMRVENLLALPETAWLSVSVTPCKSTYSCVGTPAEWASSIEPGDLEVSDDLSEGTLHADVKGMPLHIEWSQPDPEVEFSVSGGSPTHVALSRVTVASVKVFGLSCDDGAGKLARAVFEVHPDRQEDQPDGSSPPKALRMLSEPRVRCAAR